MISTDADSVEERTKGLAELAIERTKMLADVAEERVNMLADVAKERVKGLAEVDVERVKGLAEVEKSQATFFDAYFSGRYAHDVCDNGSIFVDRDGEHFGHILQYMRNGVVALAETDAHPSVSLQQALKREFGFYCIDVCAEQPAVPQRLEMVFVVGGVGIDGTSLSSMERYDAASGHWIAMAAMNTPRKGCAACTVAGELYVTGGIGIGISSIDTVEKYSPLSDSWSEVASLLDARSEHAAVAVGSAMYVLGGCVGYGSGTASVLKFDIAQGTYSEVAPMPEARYAFATCAVGKDIFVFAGEDGYTSTVCKYDTEADTWSTLEQMPTDALQHSACVLDDLIYIVGVSGSDCGILRFNPASGVWSELEPMRFSRLGGAAFVLDGCMYAVGGTGRIFPFAELCSVDRYDVDNDSWTRVANIAWNRSHFAVATIVSAGPAEEQDLFDSLIAKASNGHPPSSLT
jgi:N-acetylneuraminic acid mutarotase